MDSCQKGAWLQWGFMCEDKPAGVFAEGSVGQDEEAKEEHAGP